MAKNFLPPPGKIFILDRNLQSVLSFYRKTGLDSGSAFLESEREALVFLKGKNENQMKSIRQSIEDCNDYIQCIIREEEVTVRPAVSVINDPEKILDIAIGFANFCLVVNAAVFQKFRPEISQQHART